MATGGEEWRVDGGQGEVVVPIGGEGEGGEVEAADHAGEPNDPIVFDIPTVVQSEVLSNGIEGRRDGTSVAEHAVINALMEGFEDGGRRLEVHVGDPHRQDVATCIFLPFLGVGFLTGRRSGEVE